MSVQALRGHDCAPTDLARNEGSGPALGGAEPATLPAEGPVLDPSVDSVDFGASNDDISPLISASGRGTGACAPSQKYSMLTLGSYSMATQSFPRN